jgi:hypothetical protein
MTYKYKDLFIIAALAFFLGLVILPLFFFFLPQDLYKSTPVLIYTNGKCIEVEVDFDDVDTILTSSGLSRRTETLFETNRFEITKDDIDKSAFSEYYYHGVLKPNAQSGNKESAVVFWRVKKEKI